MLNPFSFGLSHVKVGALSCFRLAACLLLAIGLGAAAYAQKSPERINLAPDARDGVVLIKAEALAVPYLLMIQQVGQSGFGSRVYTVVMKPDRHSPAYIGRTLKPGRYVIRSIWQQSVWGLEFSKETVEFEIKAGRISYLGELNAEELLSRLQDLAIAAGKETVKLGSGYVTSDHGLAPHFDGRDDQSVRVALEFSEKIMKVNPERFDLADVMIIRGPSKQ